MRHLKEFILQTRWMFHWWHIKVYKGCFSYAWILIINNINTNNRSKSLLFQLSVITHCQTTPQLQPPPTPPSPRLSINPTQVTEKRVEQRSVTAFAPGCLNHLPVRQQKALWHLFNVTPAAEQGAFTVKKPPVCSQRYKKKKKKRYWSSLTDRLWWWRWQHVVNIFESPPAGLSRESAVSTYDASSVVCNPPTSASSAVIALCCRFSRDSCR